MSLREKIPKTRLPEIIQPENPKIKLEMERRYHNAQELGRICPDETPDFIGNFYESNKGGDFVPRPAGIFELTFTKKEDNGDFEGIIKDCFGNATIEGRLTDSVIIFTKKYIPEESSVKASNRPLIYQGLAINIYNHDFTGGWRYEDQEKFRGNFWLSKDMANNL